MGLERWHRMKQAANWKQLFLAGTGLALVCGAAFGAPQQPIVKELHVPIPMRDGVRLFANIFLPPDHARIPAILVRTPYGKGADITPNYQAFVEHGYARSEEHTSELQSL